MFGHGIMLVDPGIPCRRRVQSQQVSQSRSRTLECTGGDGHHLQRPLVDDGRIRRLSSLRSEPCQPQGEDLAVGEAGVDVIGRLNPDVAEHGRHASTGFRHALAAADMDVAVLARLVQAELARLLTNLDLRLRVLGPVPMVDTVR